MNFDLKVGFSCNNNCLHCVVGEKLEKTQKKDLSFDEIKTVVNNNLHCDRFILTGGEPTIRNDFIDICKYIKSFDKIVALQTNGMMFHKFEFAQEASKYIDDFLIAVHSYKKEVHDNIVDTQGAWDKTTEGLVNLINLERLPDMCSQTVINKLNLESLKGTYDFLYNIGFREMNLTFPHCNGNAYSNIDMVQPKYSEIEDIIDSIISKYDGLIRTEAIPLCYIYKHKQTTTAYLLGHNETVGYDQFLAENDMGDYIEYKSLIDSEHRYPKKTCSKCELINNCEGVWREYEEMYYDNLDLRPLKLLYIYRRFEDSNKRGS